MVHKFALFCPILPSFRAAHELITLCDVDFIGRCLHVLRLGPGDAIILFNGTSAYEVVIEKIDRKSVCMRVVSVISTAVERPVVVALLPLLKKNALEDAVYGCVESGVSLIQLVITEKTNRAYRHERELERLQRIVIAACEQAKQFSLPVIRAPQPLSDCLKSMKKSPLDTNAAHSLEVPGSFIQPGMSSDERSSLYRDIFLFADPAGQSFCEVLHSVNTMPIDGQIYFLVGPEGDLTAEEKRLVYASSALGIRLTPTVLRAQQAVVVLAAALVSAVFK